MSAAASDRKVAAPHCSICSKVHIAVRCSMLGAWQQHNVQTLYLKNAITRSSPALQAAAAKCTGAPQTGASTALQHEVQTLRAQLQQALRDQSR